METASWAYKIDGRAMTPKTCPPLPQPPVFDSPEQERRHRKEHLAGALRIFGRFGFSEGVAGHITVRDPEYPDLFWVNPIGVSFRQIRVSDLILISHQGEVVSGDRPYNEAAFALHSEIHAARPDIVSAAHAHSVFGKAFASLGIPLAPITQDACMFFEDHVVIEDFGGKVIDQASDARVFAARFLSGKAAIHVNHGLFTVGQTLDEAAYWFVTMERSCQAQLAAMAAGSPRIIDRELAEYSATDTGSHYAGWYSFQPLWQDICKTDPDFFE